MTTLASVDFVCMYCICTPDCNASSMADLTCSNKRLSLLHVSGPTTDKPSWSTYALYVCV